MNDIQKKYTIELIDNYEDKIAENYFKINRNTLFTFLGVGLVIAIFGVDKEFTHSEIMDNVIGILSAATAVINAANGTKRIIRQENIKSEVRQLEYALALDELEKETETKEVPKAYIKKIVEKIN